MDTAGLVKGKVGPVPYWAIAGGIVAGLVLRRMNKNKPSSIMTMKSGSGTPYGVVNSGFGAGGGIANTAPQGTVPGNAYATGPDSTIKTNQDWYSKAISALLASGATFDMADTALRNYLDGNQLSTAQSSLVEQSFRMFSPPPQMPNRAQSQPNPITIPAVPPSTQPPYNQNLGPQYQTGTGVGGSAHDGTGLGQHRSN